MSQSRFISADQPPRLYYTLSVGVLEKGAAADITVFDWSTVHDSNTRTVTDRNPTGIEHVFINGKQVMAGGRVEAGALARKVL